MNQLKFNASRVPSADPAPGKSKRFTLAPSPSPSPSTSLTVKVSGQRSMSKKTKKSSPKQLKVAKKNVGSMKGDHHFKIHARIEIERSSPTFRAQTTPVVLERKPPASKLKHSYSSRIAGRSSRHSVRSQLSSSDTDYTDYTTPTMTEVFGTAPQAGRGSTHKILVRRKTSSKKKGSSSKSKSSVKFLSKMSSRYSSMRGGSSSQRKFLRVNKSRSMVGSARSSTSGASGASGSVNIKINRLRLPQRCDYPTIPENATAYSIDCKAASTRSSVDSSTLEIVQKRTTWSQTEFEDDAYGPLHESLPPFIQRLREKRVAAAAAKGHRCSTKISTSSRSTQTRPYSSKKSGDDAQQMSSSQYVIRKLMKQQEEMLHAIELLKKDKQHIHRRSSKSATAVCSLNLEIAADDRHCDSPDMDVYSEFNSPRSRLEDVELKFPGRRRFNTEPRRTLSGRHVIPGQEDDSSGESDGGGEIHTLGSSPKQKRFSNIPPLNLAKTKISSVLTPRSYGSETLSTRSSPDRSRKCSMRLSSTGAFNPPLSNRSVQSISSSRSLLSLSSSLGAVLDDNTTKDNVSFASVSAERSETSAVEPPQPREDP
eukprot:jgi/Bigna1/74835/fgenesh1_pg.31_\